MLAEHIIWDIKEILNAVNDDAKPSEEYLLHKFNSYRELFITELYELNGATDPTWFQDIPKFDFEKVTSADDPAVTVSSVAMGKYVLPAIVSLPNEAGLRLFPLSRHMEFSPIDFHTLMLKIDVEGHVYKEYPFFSRIGNTIYVYPYFGAGKATLIAQNPMDVQILSSGAWRDRLESDPYPVGAGMAQKIIIEILVKDFNVNMQMVPDLTNDAQMQLKIMQGYGQQTAKTQ